MTDEEAEGTKTKSTAEVAVERTRREIEGKKREFDETTEATAQ